MKDFSIKKLYYSISEVSKITEVEQYVLRYWESEFENLKPQKNRAGNRVYSNKDIQLILTIKSLLREKKFTIEGAKKALFEFLQKREIANPTAESDKNEQPNLFENEDESTIRNLSLNKDLLEIKLFLENLLKNL
jgi:DNA-binding transcriptional MerR regulator